MKSNKEKNKNILKKCAIIALIVVSVFTVYMVVPEKPTWADSGHSVSHSSGGHSSSHRSSSRSRSRSSSSSSGGGFKSTGNIALDILIILGTMALSMAYPIIMIIVIVTVLKKNKSKFAIKVTPVNENEIENQIKQVLPNFNKAEFLQQGFDSYKAIQDAWMNFKLPDVRDLLTDELYNMYDSQLDIMETKHEQNVMKDITLISSGLKGFSNQNGIVTITTNYVISLYDYIINTDTQKVTSGNKNTKYKVYYEMKFRLSIDENDKIEQCPNCGANVDINGNGKCEYCGSKIVSENSKWVLTEKNVRQQYNM